jgi:hypothetical protein
MPVMQDPTIFMRAFSFPAGIVPSAPAATSEA